MEADVTILENFLEIYEKIKFFLMPIFKIYVTKKNLKGERGIVWVMQEGETLREFIEKNGLKEN